MSDQYQHIIDVEVPASEAPQRARSVMAWLAAQQIVAAQTSPCVLSPQELGYAPGSRFMDALHAQAEEPHEVLHGFLSLAVNGVECITKRHVAFDMCGSFESLICPLCKQARPQDEHWGNAVTLWEEGGEGLLTCEECANATSVAQWTHIDPWGYGALGLKFWNWPPLCEEFLEKLSERLGHRIVCVVGRL